jgi:type I restriction enzyme M protein
MVRGRRRPDLGDTSNQYCDSTDLSNEASVESFFVSRLLDDLGYEDKEIKPKRSIDELYVARGRSRELYKPDYLIVAGKRPRWLIDAKSTNEDVEDYTYQGAGYALALNREYTDRPLRFFMLTNGLLTRVYAWDQRDAILSLRFADFVSGNTRFEALKRLLAAETVRKGWEGAKPSRSTRVLLRPTIDEVKKAFKRCHRLIWKAEKMSPQASFLEFAKLLFIKLWEDRKLRDDPELLALISSGEPIPTDRLRFSGTWISAQETSEPNPVAKILFRQLSESLEQEIADRKRKRIFDPGEGLNLAPGTIKRVVRELEGFYLFGIDEDLNGRMFEAFLTATMRGQDLGQYFTPRSIVKLMSRLAKPIASAEKVEHVIDACCGTGGFLIEALTDMRGQVYSNPALTKTERATLLDNVANEAIFGIDAGKDPPVARIARINMYLHGDGGSRIYMTDGLRRIPEPSGADPLEVRQEVAELKGLLAAGPTFDVALTNPPFSMDYSMADEAEAEVLSGYELLTFEGKRRQSLRSSVMFIEQYWRLLAPGGRFLTVIDDSILGGRNYAFVRDFIRDRFIIRGVISLHGDAFRRAGARVKTSILYLTKRVSPHDSQPAAFVYETRYIGLDDVPPTTRPSVAQLAKAAAETEIEEVVAASDDYRAGKTGPWLVSADKLGGRLDAKYLKPWTVRDLEARWVAEGADVRSLEDLVEPVTTPVTLEPESEYQFLRVTYDGRAESGERALGKEVSYSTIGKATEGDIVVSNINAVNGAICVVPSGVDELLVSNEFTVLRLKPDVAADPYYLWSLLRTPGVVAEWLSAASGVGRHRVNWETLRVQRLPILALPDQQAIGEKHRQALLRQSEAQTLTNEALALLSSFGLDTEDARDRLTRAKPPR